MRHDAILRLVSVYVQPEEKHVYVVTELMHGGAVLDAILKMKDERYTEAEAKVVVRRTLEGIQYMHENGVVHRDLKLENLLLKRDDDLSSVVIADFGCAFSSTRCVSPRPETGRDGTPRPVPGRGPPSFRPLIHSFAFPRPRPRRRAREN